MTTEQEAAESKNRKIEILPCLFRPQAQHLRSRKRSATFEQDHHISCKAQLDH